MSNQKSAKDFWLKRFEIHYLYVFLFSPLHLTDTEGALFKALSGVHKESFLKHATSQAAQDVRLGDLLAYALRHKAKADTKGDAYKFVQFHMGEELEPPNLRIDVYTQWPHLSIDGTKEPVTIRLIDIAERTDLQKRYLSDRDCPAVQAKIHYHIALFDQGLGALDVVLDFHDESMRQLTQLAGYMIDNGMVQSDLTGEHLKNHAVLNLIIRLQNLGRFARPWSDCETRDLNALSQQVSGGDGTEDVNKFYGMEGRIKLALDHFNASIELDPSGNTYRYSLAVFRTDDYQNTDTERQKEVTKGRECSMHGVYKRAVICLQNRINDVIGVSANSGEDSVADESVAWDFGAWQAIMESIRTNGSDLEGNKKHIMGQPLFCAEESAIGKALFFQEPYVALVGGAEAKDLCTLAMTHVSSEEMREHSRKVLGREPITSESKSSRCIDLWIDLACLLERSCNHRTVDLLYHLKYDDMLHEVQPGTWRLLNMYPICKFFTRIHREALVTLYPVNIVGQDVDEIVNLNYYLQGLFRILEGLRGRWYVYLAKHTELNQVITEMASMISFLLTRSTMDDDTEQRYQDQLEFVARLALRTNSELMALLTYEDPLTYGTGMSPFSRVYQVGEDIMKLKQLRMSIQEKLSEIDNLYSLLVNYANTLSMREAGRILEDT